MKKLLARLAGSQLRYTLVVGFVLTAAVTVVVSALITGRVISDYLEGAQDERVGRDMELAKAFYQFKLDETDAIAYRMVRDVRVIEGLSVAQPGQAGIVETIDQQIVHKITVPIVGGTYLLVVLDAEGNVVASRARSTEGKLSPIITEGNWAGLPVVQRVLHSGTELVATEILPAEYLAQVGLDRQARIELEDTPRAAPEPFDPREGTAGLALTAVHPVRGKDGQIVGAVLAAYLFNNDFTLVDHIKEVAGVDTVTIFFGDLRVSTNVPLDGTGERAIGTRVSQEVFDQVLVEGQEFTGPAFVVNQDYITRYAPLYDHRGQVVGSLYVGAEMASFQQLDDSFRGQVFLIAGATVLLAILVAIPLAWSISRPLTDLARATRKVSLGDRSVRVSANGRGELGMLAKSFNTMVETLQDTQERLVQKEKLASVGQLAAGVAHEINNPLGTVLLYADILHKETPKDDQQHREDLQMILREATRCKTIVNDLLNFSRQNEVLAQETDLNDLLQSMVEEASRKDLYRSMELATDFDPDLPPIQADPLQLHQVFLNLMSNAAEAMPGGGLLTLRTRRGPVAGTVTVQVQDTGVGISEENMSKLFTPFFTTKPIGKGTGLGLAIIYGIVKMHRGQISVQSQEGEGTTFTLTLRERLPSQAEQSEP
ncbi:MAG: cache domain-containing protein, partial [Anaerolineae bacterium]